MQEIPEIDQVKETFTARFYMTFTYFDPTLHDTWMTIHHQGGVIKQGRIIGWTGKEVKDGTQQLQIVEKVPKKTKKQ